MATQMQLDVILAGNRGRRQASEAQREKGRQSWRSRARDKKQRRHRTHDPPSSRLDALTTELLEALWRSGSKFKYNCTSHREFYQGLSRNGPSTSVQDQDGTI